MTGWLHALLVPLPAHAHGLYRDYGCLLACDCFAAGKQHVPEETFEIEGDFAVRDPLLLVSNVVLQGTISSSVFK